MNESLYVNKHCHLVAKVTYTVLYWSEWGVAGRQANVHQLQKQKHTMGLFYVMEEGIPWICSQHISDSSNSITLNLSDFTSA